MREGGRKVRVGGRQSGEGWRENEMMERSKQG